MQKQAVLGSCVSCDVSSGGSQKVARGRDAAIAVCVRIQYPFPGLVREQSRDRECTSEPVKTEQRVSIKINLGWVACQSSENGGAGKDESGNKDTRKRGAVAKSSGSLLARLRVLPDSSSSRAV